MREPCVSDEADWRAVETDEVWTRGSSRTEAGPRSAAAPGAGAQDADGWRAVELGREHAQLELQLRQPRREPLALLVQGLGERRNLVEELTFTIGHGGVHTGQVGSKKGAVAPEAWRDATFRKSVGRILTRAPAAPASVTRGAPALHVARAKIG